MQLPSWAQDGGFWSRHYDLAELAEDACQEAVENARQAEVDALFNRDVENTISDAEFEEYMDGLYQEHVQREATERGDY